MTTYGDRTNFQMVELPSPEQRHFVSTCNELSKDHSSAGFGDPGRLVISKARRQLAFASSAWMKWPELGGGDLRTVPVEDWRMSKVDPHCLFWLAGQKQYHSALVSYWDALRSLSLDTATQRELLSEIGLHVVEDFMTEEEEAELVEYWKPGSPVFPFGVEEQGSGRRWFNYGPVLPRATSGTTKSTLTVIPSLLGEMPPSVNRQRLKERLRERAEKLLGVRNHPAFATQYDFDQMYVNYYDSARNANIEFHHDNHTCMMGAVGGVSLLSACELQLRPLDRQVQRPPLRIKLPRRSLFFMSGLSRWHLQHGIPHIPEDRISLTFRTVDRSCTREKEQWQQSWDLLLPDEAANAVWPLVRPDGVELHTLVASPSGLVDTALLRTEGGAASASAALPRVPRRSTVVQDASFVAAAPRPQGGSRCLVSRDDTPTRSAAPVSVVVVPASTTPDHHIDIAPRRDVGFTVASSRDLASAVALPKLAVEPSNEAAPQSLYSGGGGANIGGSIALRGYYAHGISDVEDMKSCMSAGVVASAGGSYYK